MNIKFLSAFFWTGVAGIVLSLGMTVYTGITEKKPEKPKIPEHEISVPAIE